MAKDKKAPASERDHDDAPNEKKLDDLYKLIEKFDTALLTTRAEDGRLMSRPMAKQDQAPGADLWFCTYKQSDKVRELRRDGAVNLGYYRDGGGEWVSVSGYATLTDDRDRIHKIYKPDWKAWFGDEGGENDGGPDDPRIILIGVDVYSAKYLISNEPKPVTLFKVLKGMVTGSPPNTGELRGVTPGEAAGGR